MVMVVKGAWKIQNLRGVFKSFKNHESDEARAWMSNRDEEVIRVPKEPKVPKVESPEKLASRLKREAKKAAKLAAENEVHEPGTYQGERDGLARCSH